jgi:NAD(P)-dependent dehydrogenase (short-subunit alcohol dehydrogenase family)
MKKLEGKVAVITGGSSGIGLATAKRFVDEGAHVVITGRREKELKEAATLIKKNVTTVVGDVSRLEDLDRLYAVVKEKHGHIAILFANAGAGTIAPLAAATEAHFDQTFDVNVKGTFFTVQKALPLFKDGGSIILNSSVSNVLGLPGFTAYAASKAAVRNFARGWALELKDRKIRVNCVSPGAIDTPALATTTGLTAEQVGQAVAQFTTQIPMGRRGVPEDIAAAVAFLASDESSYITGRESSRRWWHGAGLTPSRFRDGLSSPVSHGTALLNFNLNARSENHHELRNYRLWQDRPGAGQGVCTQGH